MLYIAIGRNVGDEPMVDARWSAFTRDVLDAIEERYGKVDTLADGNSRFGSMAEETRVMVWFDVHAMNAGTEARLGVIAGEYGQDSIAYSVAETEFIDGV